MTPPACAHCGRVVALCCRVPEGRICANCRAILKREVCRRCGKLGRVGYREADGSAWCDRCRQRHRRSLGDDARRQRVLDAVRRAEPGLDAALAGRVLDETVLHAVSLRRLAAHIDEHPDAFLVGPTSTLTVLDRFTEALVAAGATRITTIHPVCENCGRRRRWKATTATGGRCAACQRRTEVERCSVCGITRRIGRHDAQRQAICAHCVERLDRRERLDGLTAEITRSVRTAAGSSIDPADIASVVRRVAPKVPDQIELLAHLRSVPALTISAERPPGVARLLDALHAAGVELPLALCHDCNRDAVPLVVYLGVVRCGRCAMRCPGCGRYNKEPTKARCHRCVADRKRRRGTCCHCARPDQPLDGNGRCRRCRERTDRRCPRCDRQTPLTRHAGGWVCHRCALADELDDRLGTTDQLTAPLVTLWAAILEADNPSQVRKWLRNSAAGRLITDIATGDVPLTHDGLDGYGPNRSVDHLRALLVAAGALPDEDRSIDRLERFASDLLVSVADSGDRRILQSWLRWQLLPRLRARAATRASMAHSAANARRALRRSSEFLATLHQHDRTLRTATQADLDAWFARPGTNDWLARGFMVWAATRRHLPRHLRIPATPPKVLCPGGEDEERWAIARRLVTDDTIPSADRVAGALVVLYAQPLSRIARLTPGDLHRRPDATTVLTPDGNPVPIHEPIASLIEQLPARRRNGVTEQLENPWLFPGNHAGRAMTPNALGQRLRALGIEPRAMRSAARAQLAAEIPPAMLGEIIGVSATTATRWAIHTSANWNAYAANLDGTSARSGSTW